MARLDEIAEPCFFMILGDYSKQIKRINREIQLRRKGERGIRTLDSSLQTIPVFKTGAINHSAISPHETIIYYTIVV